MLFDLCGRKAEPKYDRDEEFALSLFLFCFGKKRREKRTREEEGDMGCQVAGRACWSNWTDWRTTGEQLLAFFPSRLFFFSEQVLPRRVLSNGLFPISLVYAPLSF